MVWGVIGRGGLGRSRVGCITGLSIILEWNEFDYLVIFRLSGRIGLKGATPAPSEKTLNAICVALCLLVVSTDFGFTVVP